MVEESPDIFRALADPTRRAMIEQLSRADSTIGELARPHDMSFAGASKHVGVLEASGLVTRRKRGRERVCSLRVQGLFALRDWVERHAAFWDERLDALDKAMMEDGDE